MDIHWKIFNGVSGHLYSGFAGQLTETLREMKSTNVLICAEFIILWLANFVKYAHSSSFFPTAQPTTNFPSLAPTTEFPSIQPTSQPTYSAVIINGVVSLPCVINDYSLTIPNNNDYDEMYIYMWGAGGGYGYGTGGAGAYIEGLLSVIPGETLNIVVGEGGVADGSATYGGGGSSNTVYRGSGGGRSAIQRYSSANQQYYDIVTAGGGGGGANYVGSATSYSNHTIQDTSYQGGNSGTTSTLCNFNSQGGGGGSTTTGGCSWACSSGSQYVGGGCSCGVGNQCAGGGGGYYGGGSGFEGGGGGGSSYFGDLQNYTYSMSGLPLSGTCVGQYSTYYNPNACGCSSPSCNNGYVVLTFPKAMNDLTQNPTSLPTSPPTTMPTIFDTTSPTANPTASTKSPSLSPSSLPTTSTKSPSLSPSAIPTASSTLFPTPSPTASPADGVNIIIIISVSAGGGFISCILLFFCYIRCKNYINLKLSNQRNSVGISYDETSRHSNTAGIKLTQDHSTPQATVTNELWTSGNDEPVVAIAVSVSDDNRIWMAEPRI